MQQLLPVEEHKKQINKKLHKRYLHYKVLGFWSPFLWPVQLSFPLSKKEKSSDS